MKKHSILLVDDEEIIRKTVGVDLEEKGYKVTLAKSGEEAIKMLKKSKYAIFINILIGSVNERYGISCQYP